MNGRPFLPSRATIAVLLSVTFVPLANLSYWLPYACMGKGGHAYYEFEGYFLFWYIVPGCGLGAGIVHLFVQAVTNFKWIGLAYGVCLALMLLAFFAFGIADMA